MLVSPVQDSGRGSQTSKRIGGLGMKRVHARLAAAMFFCVLVVACPPVQKELRVAIMAPLSGDLSGWGRLVSNGVMLAIDEWNSKGGVLGMKIVPVLGD